MPDLKETGKKILIVDDDALAKLSIQTILNSIGCYVEVASNGFEALSLLENKKFDLVFSDIRMPKMNGYEMTKLIRSSSMWFKNVTIIGISAYLDQKEVTKAKNMGMNDIIKKPIDLHFLKKLTLRENI